MKDLTGDRTACPSCGCIIGYLANCDAQFPPRQQDTSWEEAEGAATRLDMEHEAAEYEADKTRWILNGPVFREAAQALRDHGYSYAGREPSNGEETWLHESGGAISTLYPCGRINDIELDDWLKMKARQAGII